MLPNRMAWPLPGRTDHTWLIMKQTSALASRRPAAWDYLSRPRPPAPSGRGLLTWAGRWSPGRPGAPSRHTPPRLHLLPKQKPPGVSYCLQLAVHLCCLRLPWPFSLLFPLPLTATFLLSVFLHLFADFSLPFSLSMPPLQFLLVWTHVPPPFLIGTIISTHTHRYSFPVNTKQMGLNFSIFLWSVSLLINKNFADKKWGEQVQLPAHMKCGAKAHEIAAAAHKAYARTHTHALLHIQHGATHNKSRTIVSALRNKSTLENMHLNKTKTGTKR